MSINNSLLMNKKKSTIIIYPSFFNAIAINIKTTHTYGNASKYGIAKNSQHIITQSAQEEEIFIFLFPKTKRIATTHSNTHTY